MSRSVTADRRAAAIGALDERIIDLAVPELGLPVVYARRLGVQLTFRCPHCKRHHWHGAHSTRCHGCGCELHDGRGYACTCPVGAGDGQRMAHCDQDSPFYRTGYIVREVAS